MLAAIAAALIVPVGFALSLESAPVTPQARYAAAVPAAESVIPTAAATALAAPISTHHLVSPAAGSLFEAVPDAAKLLCVGTVLFALAAAVRKAI
jgi:hypothetical protein